MEIKEQIEKLEKKKARMDSYLTLKHEDEDYHGVADAAMDIREILAKIQVLKELDS